jgi:Mor family transcriptional regulator
MTPAINHDTDSAVELHRILTACLTRRFKLAEITASALADEIALEMRKAHGGGPIYIPSQPRALRDSQIRAAFRGNNYATLASQFGISVRWVREIIKGGA